MQILSSLRWRLFVFRQPPPTSKGLVQRPSQHDCNGDFMSILKPCRLQNPLRAVLTSICLFGLVSGSPGAAVITNDVNAAAILQAQDLQRYDGLQAATLLAFVSREDDRPWYVDDALLVLQLRKGRWVLVHAVRNPKYPPGHKGGSKEWVLYDVMDAPHVGDRYFDHRPTRWQVDQFLKDNQWPFTSDQAWRIVRRMVDADAWQRVLGYRPAWTGSS